MKLKNFLILIIVITLFILLILQQLFSFKGSQSKFELHSEKSLFQSFEEFGTQDTNLLPKQEVQKNHECQNFQCIVLCVVCCGERTTEVSTMLKSAILSAQTPLVIEIFTELRHFSYFLNWKSNWPVDVKKRVTLNVHEVSYSRLGNVWKKLFDECSSLRLFLPSLLPNVDSVIYADTDVLFLASIEKLWSKFRLMNSSQMVALSPEHVDPTIGWYNRFAKHPYYGKLGVNSGLMLMNLTRLRAFGWEEYLVPIEDSFHSKLTWGDQDIINIIFHYHPDKLLLLGCEYNYRSDFCMYRHSCGDASTKGIFAIHGNRKVFHNEKQPTFKAIYQIWEQFELDGDPRLGLYEPMAEIFKMDVGQDKCRKLGKEFLFHIQKMIDS